MRNTPKDLSPATMQHRWSSGDADSDSEPGDGSCALGPHQRMGNELPCMPPPGGPNQPLLLVCPSPQVPGNQSQGRAGGNHRTGARGTRDAVAVRPQCLPEAKEVRWPKTVRGHPLGDIHYRAVIRNGPVTKPRRDLSCSRAGRGSGPAGCPHLRPPDGRRR